MNAAFFFFDRYFLIDFLTFFFLNKASKIRRSLSSVNFYLKIVNWFQKKKKGIVFSFYNIVIRIRINHDTKFKSEGHNWLWCDQNLHWNTQEKVLIKDNQWWHYLLKQATGTSWIKKSFIFYHANEYLLFPNLAKKQQCFFFFRIKGI